MESTITRHVAKIAYSGTNADQRCVVVFMQLKDRPDHALVIPTDNLPPRIEQAVMDVLKTPEGQQAEAFADALHRHLMPDTGETILAALHNSGKLIAVPVQNILMLPRPNQPVKLTYILEQLGRLPQQQVSSQYETEKFNPHTHNQKVESTEQTRSIARGLLIEAEMLEGEAKKKRDLAYTRDPSLRTRTGLSMTETVGLAASSDPWGNTPTNIPINEQLELPFGTETGEKTVANPFETRLQALEDMITKFVENSSKDVAEPETPKKLDRERHKPMKESE